MNLIIVGGLFLGGIAISVIGTLKIVQRQWFEYQEQEQMEAKRQADMNELRESRRCGAVSDSDY